MQKSEYGPFQRIAGLTLFMDALPVVGNQMLNQSHVPITTAQELHNELQAAFTKALNHSVAVTAVRLTLGTRQFALVLVESPRDATDLARLGRISLRGWQAKVKLDDCGGNGAGGGDNGGRGAHAAHVDPAAAANAPAAAANAPAPAANAPAADRQSLASRQLDDIPVASDNKLTVAVICQCGELDRKVIAAKRPDLIVSLFDTVEFGEELNGLYVAKRVAPRGGVGEPALYDAERPTLYVRREAAGGKFKSVGMLGDRNGSTWDPFGLTPAPAHAWLGDYLIVALASSCNSSEAVDYAGLGDRQSFFVFGCCESAETFTNVNDAFTFSTSSAISPTLVAGVDSKILAMQQVFPKDAASARALEQQSYPFVFEVLPAAVQMEQDMAEVYAAATRATALMYRYVGDHYEVMLKSFPKRVNGRTVTFWGLMSDDITSSSCDPLTRVVDAAISGLRTAAGHALSPEMADSASQAMRLAARDPATCVLLSTHHLVITLDTQVTDPNTFPLQDIPRAYKVMSVVASQGFELAWFRVDCLMRDFSDRHSYSTTLQHAIKQLCTAILVSAAADAAKGASRVESQATPVDRFGKPTHRLGIEHEILNIIDRVNAEIEGVSEEIGRLMLVEDEPSPALTVVNADDLYYQKEVELCRKTYGGQALPAITAMLRVQRRNDAVLERAREVRNVGRYFHTTRAPEDALNIALNGPDFTKANPGGNSGGGFYTTPKLDISLGYGNTTLIMTGLVGKLYENTTGLSGRDTGNMRQLLQQTGNDTVHAQHADEHVFYYANQVRVDTIIFWDKAGNVDAHTQKVLAECRSLYDTADASRKQFEAKLAELRNKQTRMVAYLKMLQVIEHLEATPGEKKRLLEDEKTQYASAPSMYVVKADLIREARLHAEGSTFATHPYIFEAQTGSGKTTLVPQYLIDWVLKPAVPKGKPAQRVLVVVPTRLIALSLASSLTEMRSEGGLADAKKSVVGGEIGYSIGGKRKLDQFGFGTTRVVFMTYMMFLKGELRTNPNLETYAAVLFDEAHKQQEDVNITLALLPLLQKRRPDIFWAVMSATLTPEQRKGGTFSRKFLVETITFPITTFAVAPLQEAEERDIVGSVMNCVTTIVNRGPSGNILCFMPTTGEADKGRDAAEAKFGNYDVYSLHARSRPDVRRAVTRPVAAGGKLRIIFATNYAEQGVTLDNIAHVVDCGRTLTSRFNAQQNQMFVEYISKAAAQQRKGRTGRTCLGEYYQVYDAAKLRNNGPGDDDDVARRDKVPVMWVNWLPSLIAYGVQSPLALRYPHPPTHKDLATAFTKLDKLGLLASVVPSKLSEDGDRVEAMPFETELACFVNRCSNLTVAGKAGVLEKAAAMVAAVIKEDKLMNLLKNADYPLLQTHLNNCRANIKCVSDFYGLYLSFRDGFDAYWSRKAGVNFTFHDVGADVFERMALDVERALDAIASGSPAKQAELVKNTLDDCCSVKVLRKHLISMCRTMKELTDAIDQVDQWFDEAPDGFTKADVRAVGQAITTCRNGRSGSQVADVASIEDGLVKVAAEVFRYNVAYANDLTTWTKGCFVTTDNLESCMVPGRETFLRPNMGSDEAIVYMRWDHVTGVDLNVLSFLHYCTIVKASDVAMAADFSSALAGMYAGGVTGGGVQQAVNIKLMRFVIVVPSAVKFAVGATVGSSSQATAFRDPAFPGRLVVGFKNVNGVQEAEVTSMIATQMYPRLKRVLDATTVPGFATAEDFYLSVGHILIHGLRFGVYGGYIRDFLLRREDPHDVDTSIPPQFAAQGQAAMLTAMQATFTPKGFTVATGQQKPSVALVCTIAAGGHSVSVELVDPTWFPHVVDMSCNNVYLSANGLAHKVAGGGRTLAHVLWQIKHKKGTVLDLTESNYQFGRRQKMLQRGWDLWNVNKGNYRVDPNATIPKELTSDTVDLN